MSVFDNVRTQLDKVNKILKLNEKEMDILKEPNKIIEKEFSVEMDSGDVKKFKGYRQ